MTRKHAEEPAIDYKSVRKLSKKFPDLIREQAEVKAMIKTLEVREEEIKDQITPMMVVAKTKVIQVDDHRATLCHGKNAKIDGRRLLERGVASNVIQASTVTVEYDYVLITTLPSEEG